MHSGLNISQTDPRPMYAQIMQQIRQRIAAGDWAPGQELPSIRALAAGLNISVITIKRAYEELESEGAIETHHGKGSFVARRPVRSDSRHEDELEIHLTAAVGVARVLGLSFEDLTRRLRKAQRDLEKQV
ncbi:MAG: GntR family transcriptional regulator [Povalibacter sp.]